MKLSMAFGLAHNFMWETNIRIFDIFAILIYLSLTLVVGLVVGRSTNTSTDFITAGGKVPGWAVGLSIFGTYVSSITFLALPGNAYKSGWRAFAFSLSIPIATWIATRWFVKFYREQAVYSAYAHLQQRFGAWARLYASCCFILTQIFRIGMILYLVVIAVEPILKCPVWLLILIIGLAVLAYATIGGMRSVIWTDVMQSIVLIWGALICITVLLVAYNGELKQLFYASYKAGKWGMGPYEFSLANETFWVVFIYGLVTNLNNFGIDQNYVQRYFTAATEKEAKKSVWLGGLIYIPVSMVFLGIGSCLYGWYHTSGYDPNFVATLDEKPDKAFPYFIATVLPAGISGIVVAAILAAAQSTISSSMNSCATLILYDIIPSYKLKNRNQMLSLRLSTFLVGAIGIGSAFVVMGSQSALEVWWKGASVLSGGVLGLFLTSLVVKKTSYVWSLIGLVLGVMIIGYIVLSPGLPYLKIHPYLANGAGTLAIVLVCCVGSVLSKK